MAGVDREFVVVPRASSGARFKHDEQWQVNGFPSEHGLVTVTFRTRYAEEGFEAAVPRELYAEVRGPAPSLDDAISPFTFSARLLVPFISLAANAPVDELEPQLGHESTPGATESRPSSRATSRTSEDCHGRVAASQQPKPRHYYRPWRLTRSQNAFIAHSCITTAP